jgi:hypothetical protein
MVFEFHNDDEQLAGTERDVRNSDPTTAILRENNLLPNIDDQLVPVRCVVCGVLNQHDTDYCTDCGAVTSLTAAYAHQQAHLLREHLNATLVNLLLQQGLLDDAVQAAHDAQLGDTLRRIATNDFTKAQLTRDSLGR